MTDRVSAHGCPKAETSQKNTEKDSITVGFRYNKPQKNCFGNCPVDLSGGFGRLSGQISRDGSAARRTSPNPQHPAGETFKSCFNAIS
jgi:hypothetical protein